MRYVLELHNNSTDDLVAIIENGYEILWDQLINEPHYLEFFLKATDDKLASVVLANDIWLREYETQDVLRKFILQKKVDERDRDRLATRIEALDYLSQLNRSNILDYSVEEETVDDIIDDLLDFQLWEPKVTKGTIDATYAALTRSVQGDGDTILRALLKLRDTVGGYIEVDNDRKLNWTSTLGEDKGQQIRYKKNLTGIEREIDYTELYNRIYAYGAGEGEARIELTAPGYVEDAASQAAWGGIYTGTFVDKTITHPDTLAAWAALLLDSYKTPPTSYRVSLLDYSTHADESSGGFPYTFPIVFAVGYGFEALSLGSTVTVIDEDLGIDVETTIVRIEHSDLLYPQKIHVELETRSKNILDSISETWDTQQFNQHIATEIGAGQVVVKGTFKVSDWINAGETTIAGDNIRTGQIESNNWAADAGSQYDLDAGTIKLGGSDDPKFHFDGTDLTLKGILTVDNVQTTNDQTGHQYLVDYVSIAPGSYAEGEYELSKGYIYSFWYDIRTFPASEVPITYYVVGISSIGTAVSIEHSTTLQGVNKREAGSFVLYTGRSDWPTTPKVHMRIYNRDTIAHTFFGYISGQRIL